MNVLLASLGTAGDVHPFLAIGRALAARGHRVELLSNPVFAPHATAAGLAFTPVGEESHYRATIAHHYTWHAVNGFGVMWRYLARPAIPAALARFEAARHEPGTVVLYSPFLMPAARIAQEAWGLRAVTAWTAPQMVPNFQPPLCLTGLRIPRWVPRPLARAAVRALDRRKMQPLALPAVEAARAPLGLPPVDRSIFGAWLHSPLLGIALFPSWFAAPTPDWPQPFVQAGFPLYDGDAGGGLSPALAAFLDAGTPPLVFTAGTGMTGARAFFESALQASARLGERALLLAAEPGQLPASLPPGALAQPYAPFPLLLPACRALVHHGGIGTLAQALRAGLPQLVVPRAYDQFDNAMRLERLGVSRTLHAGRVDGASLARVLRALLADPRVERGCALAAERLDAEQPLARVCEALEALP